MVLIVSQDKKKNTSNKLKTHMSREGRKLHKKECENLQCNLRQKKCENNLKNKKDNL
jgi:hypothetical protein